MEELMERLGCNCAYVQNGEGKAFVNGIIVRRPNKRKLVILASHEGIIDAITSEVDLTSILNTELFN